MPLEFLLRHVLLAPAFCGLGAALLLLAAGRGRWPAWAGLAWAAAFGAAIALHPNFARGLPPETAEEWLAWSAAAFALLGLVRLPGPVAGWGRLLRDALPVLPVTALLAWRTAAPVREHYGWSGLEFAGVLAGATLAGGFSVALHRAVARSHPAPAVLAGWIVIATGAALALMLGDLAKGAEFGGALAAALGPVFLLALLRERGAAAEALAAPVAGALFAILMFGLLQAELIWISAALLLLLAPAAGLLRLRNSGTLSAVGALVFVAALPSAAAVFMSFMKHAAGADSGGGD